MKKSNEMFLLHEANGISEKSVFYEGKYDPWKDAENKKNHLYNQFYLVPPGTLPVAKGLFVDQTEVANIHYREFLYHIVKDSGAYADQQYLPKIDNKFKTKYFKNPEFSFYPVVGVSYENAQKYCDWRAKKVNENLKELLANQVKKYRYNGRLPREAEWKKIAGSSSYIQTKLHAFGKKELTFFEEDIIQNRFASSSLLMKKYFGYNVNLKADAPEEMDIEIPLYIYSFERNDKGFYNLYGNVKELVEEGYSIGGSFKTGSDEEALFTPDDIQVYRTDVGFRCLMEIARRK